MSTVSYPHIELSSNGVAFLEGTPTKVVEIALDRLSHHWDAEKIQRQGCIRKTAADCVSK